MGSKERGEQISVVISLKELGYPKPTWDDAKKLVATLNREAACIVLAQDNLFLAVASIQSYQKGDLMIRRYAQERLISNFISEKRLDEIRQTVGDADLIDRILVHRSLAMAALRLVAMHGQADGGNKLEKREDFDVLGELALVINSVTEPDAAHLSPCDIAAQISPSRELENHPDLGLTLARMERMLGLHLPRRAKGGGSALEIAKHAEQVFTFETNGFNFQSFRDMTFAMFAYYSTLDLKSVVQDQSITYFNPKHSSKVIEPELLDKFVALQAVDFADVPAFLAKDAAADRLLSDFTAFRQKPFWRFPDGAYLCIDPAFLMDKLAEGTYWWVMDGLGPRDDAASDEHRENFASLWGYIFEDYVDEQLACAHAGREHLLHPHPYYVKGDESFDDIVIEGSDLVAMQCKGAFLPIDARYSGKCEPFLAGLNKRFGFDAGAACEQLLRNLQFTFGIDGERRVVKGVDISSVKTIYPLAIVQEPLLGFWLASKLLVEEFVRRSERILWKLDLKVRPVVFMTIEELETITAYINAKDFTLAEFLREKLGTDREHRLSVGQFLHRVVLESRRAAPRRNEFMAAILDETKKEANARWESGIYI